MTTRADILRAADHLFGEVGFDATTTREIADACGVNRALIHYHFASKDGLFEAVLEAYYDELDQVLREALGGRVDARTRLHRVLEVYTDFLAANRRFSRMVQRESSGGRHLSRIVARMVPIFERGVGFVREAYPATRGGDLEAVQLLVSFYGMVVGYFAHAPVLEGLSERNPLDADDLARRKRHLHRMLDLTLDALETASAEGTQDTGGPPASRRGESS